MSSATPSPLRAIRHPPGSAFRSRAARPPCRAWSASVAEPHNMTPQNVGRPPQKTREGRGPSRTLIFHSQATSPCPPRSPRWGRGRESAMTGPQRMLLPGQRQPRPLYDPPEAAQRRVPRAPQRHARRGVRAPPHPCDRRRARRVGGLDHALRGGLTHNATRQACRARASTALARTGDPDGRPHGQGGCRVDRPAVPPRRGRRGRRGVGAQGREGLEIDGVQAPRRPGHRPSWRPNEPP